MELKRFYKMGYRGSPESCSWDKETTVADVIRFEQEELGNKINPVMSLVSVFGKVKALGNLVWVTDNIDSALEYSREGDELTEYPEVYGWVIIANDTDNGYLLLNPNVFLTLDKNLLS